ncbi:MAG: pyridoxal-phosphate dependent enzyme [Candidatus Melainabacteria bacterium]|nr:pyridoxal-phosphate dependent enzyme [Candidatus Melainabacteria bacterium]
MIWQESVARNPLLSPLRVAAANASVLEMPRLSGVGWLEEPQTTAYSGKTTAPTVDDQGQISLPGGPGGLSTAAYIPLMHLYTSILEAERILTPYRSLLRLRPDPHQVHATLTNLDASSRTPYLYYKREDQTATRAYKLRGAFVCMARAMETQGYQRFLCVSTGNHALGVLKAAEVLRPESARIVVPVNTAKHKLQKIQSRVQDLKDQGVNASVDLQGRNFDEARQWAMDQSDGDYYIDPYSNPWVVAGQGTVGLELYRQVAQLLEHNQSLVEELVLISPVGGGGLLSGTATALQLASAWDPRFQSIRVHCLGLRLAGQETRYGDAIKVKEVAQGNQMLFQVLQIPLWPVDDTTMAEGMRFVFDDLGAMVEGPSGATCVPTLQVADYQPSCKRWVVCLLSGGNVSHFPGGTTPSVTTS